MKVPYIESPFKVISIHHCTVLGEGVCSGSGGGTGAQKPYMGLLREKVENGKFSILIFKDIGMGTKFGQKMKSIC